ncbi:hypothetical protein ADK67_03400 [Saccharothrix sp. NRRL B-16348]|nr:hypothetical protein ADK67_03400 [Saccharothrix sp. NRRL B-16348]
MDDGTGLHHNRARYYSPTLQRFISEDPTGFNGGYNLHAYAANRPTVFVDPAGTKPAPSGGINNPPSRGMTGAQPGQNGVNRKDVSGSSGRIADETRTTGQLVARPRCAGPVDRGRVPVPRQGDRHHPEQPDRAAQGGDRQGDHGELRQARPERARARAHTHPVYKTDRSHFGKDLSAAHPDRVEAVIDWSGAVTYYKRDTFVSAPPKPMINEYGYLVGYRP